MKFWWFVDVFGNDELCIWLDLNESGNLVFFGRLQVGLLASSWVSLYLNWSIAFQTRFLTS